MPTLVQHSAALSNSSVSRFDGRQGHLVTITSAAENNFVMALTGSTSFWMAGGDVQEGVWRWTAGPESGRLLDIYPTFWASGEPTGSKLENALCYLSSAQGWADYFHIGFLGYVIEYECPFNPFSTGYCSRKSQLLLNNFTLILTMLIS